ncbi:MAG: hypothetical protein US70_C0012G0005 [Parcubacteria group bacterium GW2011_GWD2_38_11]|nr:MAG: hypothetical protein US70_C0012G0005 [Parcubacteria group bacterium GW2011_GWD2_38_11]
MSIFPAIAPEIVLFITSLESSKPLKICYESIRFERRQFEHIVGNANLTDLASNEKEGIEIELKKRVVIVRSKNNSANKKNGFVKIIWPGQSTIIKIGKKKFEFRVEKCNY